MAIYSNSQYLLLKKSQILNVFRNNEKRLQDDELAQRRWDTRVTQDAIAETDPAERDPHGVAGEFLQRQRRLTWSDERLHKFAEPVEDTTCISM